MDCDDAPAKEKKSFTLSRHTSKRQLSFVGTDGVKRNTKRQRKTTRSKSPREAPSKPTVKRRIPTFKPIPDYGCNDDDDDKNDSFSLSPIIHKKKRTATRGIDLSILDTPPRARRKIVDSVLQVVNDEDDDDEDDSLTGTSIFVRKETYCAEREETSNHGEQDAVKKGSEDQAKEASENAGGEEQELSQGGSDDVHVKHQKPVPSRRAAPPSKESLFASVDALYLRADVAHMKVKEFMAAIEEKYGMPLEKPTRSLVKKRLMQLIAKKVLSPVNPKGLASTAAPTAQVSPRKAPNDDTKHDSESNHQIKSTSGRRSGKASKETCSRVDEQQGAATTKIATTRASPGTTGTTDKKSKLSGKAVRMASGLSTAPSRARDKEVPTPNATDTDKMLVEKKS